MFTEVLVSYPKIACIRVFVRTFSFFLIKKQHKIKQKQTKKQLEQQQKINKTKKKQNLKKSLGDSPLI